MIGNRTLFTTKKDRNDFFIALVIIIVFGILIFRIMSIGSGAENSIVENTITEVPEVNPEIQETIPQKPEENTTLSSVYIGVEDSLAAHKRPKKEFYVGPLDLDTIPAITSDSGDMPKEKEMLHPDGKNGLLLKDSISTQIVTSNEGTILKDTIDTKEEDNIVLKDTVSSVYKLKGTIVKIKDHTLQKEDVVDAVAVESKNTVASPNTDTLPDVTTDCTLIIGVYKEITNANKTILKLQKNGFNTHRGKTNSGLHYTGVPVDCDDQNEIRHMKQLILDDLGIKSWKRKN